MSLLTVYCAQSSPRLQYVLDWLLGEVLGTGYQLVHTEEPVGEERFFISYGRKLPGALTIPDAGLLWEQEIHDVRAEVGNWKGLPVLFARPGDHSLSFDLFSAIFYLISRYEEYLAYAPDKHDRYPAEASILYKFGLLERPVVDEWIAAFAGLIRAGGFPIAIQQGFQFRPTYDIDIAYSFKHKGWVRTAGALARSILSVDLRDAKHRFRVLTGKQQDPFDCFGWLQALHQSAGLAPVYFVLAALKPSAYDRNISPRHPQMRGLVQSFLQEGRLGLHPSYDAVGSAAFQEEKKTLEEAGQCAIHSSRQHYIRMKFPETYRFLVEQGITEDWSMGYGAALGFRAGTGRSFLWYDLEAEMATHLRVYPFCFMDSTARFEEELDAEEAYERLNAMAARLRATGSPLTTVFHNFSLGSDPGWQGWREQYARFVKECS